jgi:hypothetical protein
MYSITQIGFASLTLISFYLLVNTFKGALAKSSLPIERQKNVIKAITISLLGWALVVSALSLSGILGRFDLFPLNVAPILIIPFVTISIFTFSKTLREIVTHLEPQQLIQLQVFRVFVEVLLWMLVIENLLPVQMSFEGRNFDILSGLIAAIVAWLAYKNKASKTILIVYNLLGLGLLINIVTIAILSMPTPFQYFINEPSNTIVTLFPFSWLPAFLVPLAYMLHFFSLRQVLMKNSNSV